jgi:hypothetical protein
MFVKLESSSDSSYQLNIHCVSSLDDVSTNS